MKFQQKVWELLKEIPKGRVTTYKILSEKMEVKAYQAVGNACHENPFSPSIPCHRVIKSNGKIGGFANGVEKKIKLLEKEGIEVKNDRVLNFKKHLYYF